MSSLSSDSEFISNSESSEFSGYELEAESQSIEQTLSSSDLSSEDEAYAYGNDPIAVAEWTANYEAEMQEVEMLEQMLKDRLDGSVQLNEW